ncbi:outer membrane beta-barrel protein [Methylobacterium sp. NEAU 140]|uniref:outer membrane protein n=1 Tax=Methylobacterium sp. NEAU 140 TaxID=3064945 RepID=UPI0027345D8A|nr:outer membrane beta-barrel protein [Methylobacterium sp. NEAU 140]MDP4021654.1 outer membrane beta-barrel protein [Methylobacterium sp. NEAU 140]
MRALTLSLLAALGLGAASTARAADLDYDYLRGADYDPAPVAVLDWSGVYLGGHGGYTSAAVGSKGTLQSLIYQRSHDSTAETDFRASTLINPSNARVGDVTFGGYVGYNMQFDQFVFGIEGDYTSFGRMAVSGDRIGRFGTSSTGLFETVSLNGYSATRVNDYGTIRGRAGYVLGSFMPYVTAGLAIGRARIADTVAYRDYGYSLTAYNATLAGNATYVDRFGYTSFNPASPADGTPAVSLLARTRTRVVAGFAAGVGLEYAVTPNILLRGEYQYVLLNNFDGRKINLNTVRGGAAVKF